VGDVIEEVNREPVRSPDDFDNATAAASDSDRILIFTGGAIPAISSLASKRLSFQHGNGEAAAIARHGLLRHQGYFVA
jgi:hypothetical protein